ncbi:3-dehydroquinate synthase II [Methanolinea mesophila]|uniref:3-dehydroquinate synthase II n=1 Tax=Methanolinea mesophila TaxID=547055 RepID=UPI001AE9A321|nr:3-dehydroquinate synthase II [Methanolinea mesophila]MBP1927865.1 3-dehydroquinate synthase II [Methanolinea mesophila]
MKEFWVDIRPWDKNIATTALESGADVLVVDRASNAKELSRIVVVAPDGDMVPGKDVFEVTIKGKADEEEAVKRSVQGPVIVSTSDWTVIPLENLVAQSDRIYAVVKDEKEAALALSVLEKGVKGVVLRTCDPAMVRKVGLAVRKSSGHAELVPFTVTAIRPVGMGDRVCVDTCTLLTPGEGMLVGNTSSAFLLVHAETMENPYVAPRPFRVNAGAVHAYILLPGGKTAYLSDLKTGDRVTVADAEGDLSDAVVGRVKIEKRPLLLVEAESGSSKVSLVLQNAETIRLVGEDGASLSVVELSPGDRILGCIMEGGRHFGMAVKEHITEK